jgi:hypothetical protein
MNPSHALLAALTALASMPPASAQEPAKVLGKTDVEAIVATHHLDFVRDADHRQIAYEFRGGDLFFATQTQSGYKFTASATYEVTDEGRLCVKWRRNGYFTPTDTCYAFRHEGDRIVIGRGAEDRIGEMTR